MSLTNNTAAAYARLVLAWRRPVIAALVLATLAAGLYPAWKVGRIEPVESINLV